jgi:SAM-dependent methyltransferase
MEPDRPSAWLDQLQVFFETRSDIIKGGRLSNEELCYVSGREPRLWKDERQYADLLASIRDQLELREDHRLLEVGCAAGFLARGLAGCARRYVGVDLARTAAVVARSLRLPGAAFVQGDGAALPFADEAFDRVISYDVFTNIAEWKTAEAIVGEMARVARPGGKVMVGSLADARTQEEFERIVGEVAEELDLKYGPVPAIRRPFWRSWRRRPRDFGQIVCYYFNRQDFLDLGTRLGIDVRIENIHQRNPYVGYRFNVVYTKPRR